MNKAIPIVERKFLLLQLIKIMSKHIPEFYESILEASKRGELWGISSEQSYWIQIEFALNFHVNG